MHPVEPSAPAAGTMTGPLSPPGGDTWLGLSDCELPVADVSAWVVHPSCGGVVVFTGTTRDHGDEGRPGVTLLEYEAYAEHVVSAFERVASEARRRWPVLGRLVILHRVGALVVGDAAVVVAVSAPHREEAFEAAHFCIDEVKGTAPIWKREHWSGGVDWGRCDDEPLPATAGWSPASAPPGTSR